MPAELLLVIGQENSCSNSFIPWDKEPGMLWEIPGAVGDPCGVKEERSRL